MSMFVVANLGDAALNIPSSAVTVGGTVLTGGYLFVNNATTSPITLTLASGLSPFILIKDMAGNAGTYPITVSYAGGIDGVTSVQLATSYQGVWLTWNGSNYSIIG